MLFRIITWMFVIAIVYRVITRYIMPIFRLTTAASGRMRQMQDQLKEMDRKVNNTTTNNNPVRVKKEGDYIEYEELK